MKIKTTNADKLRKIFETIGNIVDEVVIKVEEEGIKIRAIDPGHIALVDFEMSKNAFDEYELTSPAKIGIDLKPLVNVLKRAEDNVVFELKESGATLVVSSFGNVKKRFEIPLIDITEEALKIPELNFEAEVEMQSGVLKSAISDAAVFGEQVTISVNENEIAFITKSDENVSETKIDKDNCFSFNLKAANEKKEARSTFTLEYLEDIIKIADIIDRVKIFVGTDIPLKLEFVNENIKIIFFLAPRIAE